MHLQPLRGAIVAMTKDNVIGLDGRIPWHYSDDLKRFKQRTMNSIIVMGRLTWESIGSKPLPGRRNIVISRNPVANAECYTRVEDALSACGTSDTWVIGGGQIYQATRGWINLLDVTYVPDTIDHPDAIRFPEIDLEIWKKTQTTPLKNTELENVIYHRR